MSKKKTYGSILLCGIIGLSSCTITRPLGATSNPVGSKVGKAKTQSVLGFVLKPNGGVATAAKNGNISKISTIDIKTTNYLMIFNTTETIVTGE